MNKKEFAVVAVVLLFAIVAGGLTVVMPGKNNDKTTSTGGSGHGHADTQAPAHAEDLTSQTEVQLDIKGSAYSKRDITVKKGTTVTWTNRDSVEHNAMLEHADSGHAHPAPEPNEVQPNVFAGPLLKKGESYSFTFTKIGTNPYHCAPHPYMQGTVTVVE